MVTAYVLVLLIPGKTKQQCTSDSPVRLHLKYNSLRAKTSLVKTDFRTVWNWALAKKPGKTQSELLKM